MNQHTACFRQSYTVNGMILKKGFNYQMMIKSSMWLIRGIKNVFSCFMLIRLVYKMKEKEVA